MRKLILVAAALAGASAAQAEVLRVENYTPARSDELASVRTIQVETLGGRSGTTLSFQIEDKLREIDVGQGPWFRVVPASFNTGEGDALLRGTADMNLRTSDYTEQRERCVKDDKGNCTAAKEKYPVPCYRRNFDFTVTLRMVRRDGSLVWASDKGEVHSDTRCADHSGDFASPSTIERMLAERIARRIQPEFAPRRDYLDVRVDESRRGLAGTDSDAFKAAVRMVKDQRFQDACAAWDELGTRYPQHLPTQFNTALCAEFLGQADRAEAQYRQVRTLDPRHGPASAGLTRLANRARAIRQIELHGGG